MKKDNLNILLIGSGGREHALAWKLAQSERVSNIHVLATNAGLAKIQKVVQHLDTISPLDFAKENNIDLCLVGPEVPLAAGIVDDLAEIGISAFGPKKAAAQLEASKAFAKDFMQQHNIPTASSKSFTDNGEAIAFIKEIDDAKKLVIKASGLAAGKGVILPETMDEAVHAISSIMVEKNFADAGDTVVIEERLIGEEFSVLAFCDGNTVVAMPAAQDHKRALEGDKGLNTGGMGAYAPAPIADAATMAQVQHDVLEPTLAGMKAEGQPYTGILYAGMMKTADGLKVLEFNCRFGDPETQVILPLLKTDLVDIIEHCLNSTLHELNIEWIEKDCATVVLASGGYPQNYSKGIKISGLDTESESTSENKSNTVVFHAGTRQDEQGNVLTNGGRVLNVTSHGDNLTEALQNCYKRIDTINFNGMHYRKDIGFRALTQKKEESFES